MGNLLEALGVNVDDPKVIEARKDAHTLTETILQLVRRRKHLKLKQKELAKIMGTSQSTVSEFEKLGGNPTLFTLQRYARAVDAELVVQVKARNGRYHQTQGWTDFKVHTGGNVRLGNAPIPEPWTSEQLERGRVNSA
ncbi:helix-turn-helix domain-containing protein [Pseudarthrobacter sp. CCNWLW207]|uniref:helix-turn-helix domain-containing protein n=1 Tax=Pseudarthrobacter sp. CCNWLW207 TaxID=3127468 RepID=UPI003076C6EB